MPATRPTAGAARGCGGSEPWKFAGYITSPRGGGRQWNPLRRLRSSRPPPHAHTHARPGPGGKSSGERTAVGLQRWENHIMRVWAYYIILYYMHIILDYMNIMLDYMHRTLTASQSNDCSTTAFVTTCLPRPPPPQRQHTLKPDPGADGGRGARVRGVRAMDVCRIHHVPPGGGRQWNPLRRLRSSRPPHTH